MKNETEPKKKGCKIRYIHTKDEWGGEKKNGFESESHRRIQAQKNYEGELKIIKTCASIEHKKCVHVGYANEYDDTKGRKG